MSKRFIKGFLIFLISAAAILAICIAPIDRTPLQEQPYYREMMSVLDTIRFNEHTTPGRLRTGWSKVGIVPDYSMPMAGYGPRKRYEEIHDSLFVRTLAIGNGAITAYLVSIDLLIFPPQLMQRVNEKISELHDPNIFIYYSATHTHSGIGGWDPSLVGKITMGKYHDEWIESTGDLIVQQLIETKAKLKFSSLSYLEVAAPSFVYNRIDNNSRVDDRIRGIHIVREDSSTAMVVSYSAHPTSLSSKSKIVSGDYPAYMIQHIETENDFGMFLAGMMGSHGLEEHNRNGFDLIENAGIELGKLTRLAGPSSYFDSATISAKHIPVIQGPSQLRITKNFHVRDWILRAAMRPLQAEITFLEIGDLILLGTSCDFSGEIYVNEALEKLASEKGKKLMITSFNGNYTGYITADHHYDVLDEDEVRTMNWVGPNYGTYYTDIIRHILNRL